MFSYQIIDFNSMGKHKRNQSAWKSEELYFLQQFIIQTYFLNEIFCMYQSTRAAGPQPFWHQGLVSWKTVFPLMLEGRDASGGNVSDGKRQMKLRSLACLPLTSCCAARLVTGCSRYWSWDQGLGTLGLEKEWDKIEETKRTEHQKTWFGLGPAPRYWAFC